MLLAYFTLAHLEALCMKRALLICFLTAQTITSTISTTRDSRGLGTIRPNLSHRKICQKQVSAYMTISYLPTKRSMLLMHSSNLAYSDPRYIGPNASFSPLPRWKAIKNMSEFIPSFGPLGGTNYESQNDSRASSITHSSPSLKY